jgi:hypothetical protein
MIGSVPKMCSSAKISTVAWIHIGSIPLVNCGVQTNPGRMIYRKSLKKTFVKPVRISSGFRHFVPFQMVTTGGYCLTD